MNTPGTKTPREPADTSSEWAALLQCACPEPNSTRSGELSDSLLNWSALFALAEEHALLPQMAARLRAVDPKLVPSEVREELLEWNRQHTIFTLSLIAELFRLMDRFATLSLEFLVTKGPVLAQRCYGDPSLRQYSDLDLIVRQRDVRRASEAMTELGYEPRIPRQVLLAGKIPGEYVFHRPGTGLLVEFHTERTFRYHPRPLQLEAVFGRKSNVRLDNREVPALSLEDELVLICIHSAKHLWEQLSWVADVAALIVRQPALDWHRLTVGAQEVGAERMLQVGLHLASTMLDLCLPPEVHAEFRSDAGALRLAAQLARRMPLAVSTRVGILNRAMFRMQMRGSFLRGIPYLLRLTFSPTEEDWRVGSEQKRARVIESLSRPFRLLRKYGPKPEMKGAQIVKSEPS